MYKQTELPYKQTWVAMLSELRVGDTMLADILDRTKVATSISNNYHRKDIARFKISKVDAKTIKITRLK